MDYFGHLRVSLKTDNDPGNRDPCILNTVLDSLSFGISEFHLRMRHICRPKLSHNLTILDTFFINQRKNS
jgi:hypothetical protein